MSYSVSSETSMNSIDSDDYKLSFQVPVKVTVLVQEDIRQYLKMKHVDRKSKLILAKQLTEKQLTVNYLRDMLEKQLPSLYKQPYVLRLDVE